MASVWLRQPRHLSPPGQPTQSNRNSADQLERSRRRSRHEPQSVCGSSGVSAASKALRSFSRFYPRCSGRRPCRHTALAYCQGGGLRRRAADRTRRSIEPAWGLRTTRGPIHHSAFRRHAAEGRPGACAPPRSPASASAWRRASSALDPLDSRGTCRRQRARTPPCELKKTVVFVTP